MVSAAEGAIVAGEAQALTERQAELAKAKPQMSLLHHMAATQAMRWGFTIMLGRWQRL
jgi:hypothetical protein